MLRSPSGRKLAIRARAARRLVLIVGLFAVAASLPFIKAGARQQEEDQPRRSQTAVKGQANIIDGAEFVPGDVLVRFRSDAAAKSAEASPVSLQRAENNGEVTFQHFEGSDIVRGLRLAKVDPARTLEAVAELAARSDVLYAEPNYIWRAKRTPNDPLFNQMYGLNRINAPTAWNTTTGSPDVVVGVIDEGIDINHPDLKQNIWTNTGEVAGNNFDDDGNGYADDVNGWDFSTCAEGTGPNTICGDRTVYDGPGTGPDGFPTDGHGTHVAGTIGARGDNNIGVTGVNWDVRIMPIKVLGANGGAVANILRGYRYALLMRQRGVNLRVLNNSYGGTGKSLSALEAVQQLNTAGILFVVAAGNDSRDNFGIPDYPASYDVANVIGVASTDSADGLSTFSNFGERVVSIGAPGTSILSTMARPSAQATYESNGYALVGGTSMASPHVAGAAALVIAANPNITLSQLRGVLAFTGDRIASLDGKTTTGRRLNVANAVAGALENGGTADATPPATAGNLRVTGQSGRSVTLAWTAPGDDGNSGTVADYDFFFVNPTTQARNLLPTTLIPTAAGSQQSVAVNVPLRNFSGTIQLRAYDNAGNTSTTSIAVTVPVNAGSDPYTVALSAAQPLTTDTATNLFPSGGDDKYASYTLPGNFNFPFFGVSRKNMTVSSNGTIYFSTPARRSNGDADDAGSSSEAMQGQAMIAGLWDDIDLDRTARADSGVYVSQPDANRVVFRWQGVTFQFRTRVSFEIELRSDGTIQMRYSEGQKVFPVVGISSGEPDAYIVPSHTSETLQVNLSGAQTVTFALRDTGFVVSGRVTENGNGLSGVTITLSGSLSATTTTDSNGNYSFVNLPGGGNYGFTPSKQGYTFTPPGSSLFNLAANGTINFTAAVANSVGPNSVGLAQANYQYGEGDGRATFTVTRAGDTSGAVTVDYRTTDSDTFNIGCADTVNNAGGAFARCDFAATVGRLSFAAGEISKNITVPIIDDGHDENAETFQLQLSNAIGTGTSLGAQNLASVILQDNDTGVVQNPVTSSIPFFVRQHYLDFLSREPEASEPWSGVMVRCADINTGPATNTDCDRIAVSRAFLESPEFNVKGFYAFRFYKLAFNRLPQYTEIVSDMSFVAGATEAEVYARKAQLASAFTLRQEFLNAYNSMTNAQYVAALFARYSLASVTTPDPLTPDSGTRVALSANELTNRLNASQLTRAQVFRAVADSDQVQALEFNSAFIAMQYYGYLRRTPEVSGYQANLDALERGTSRREMVNAFLNSTEYRLRFGQP